ncbi:MAG: hypothetical protein R3C56_10150 [Pirellulaceae bacterium]
MKLHIDQVTTSRPFENAELFELDWKVVGESDRGGFDSGMTHGDHNRGGRHGDVGLDIGRKEHAADNSWINRD